MLNNYRDRDQDAKSGKKTIVVRWRANAGQQLYLFLIIAAFCLLLLAHLGCIITPNLSVTSLHGMAKNGKNQQGKRIKQHIGRNLLQYAAIFGVLLAFTLFYTFWQDLTEDISQ